jgi:hypothetical protein
MVIYGMLYHADSGDQLLVIDNEWRTVDLILK